MTPRRARLAYEELKRYGQVVAVLTRYGFQNTMDRMNAGHDVPWRDRIFKRQMRTTEGLSAPQRVRFALEELGPTYVKFGQGLSSRPDLLPDDYTRELSKLQDNVSPFPFHEAKAIIEGQLGHPLRDLYDDFENEPTAAGSLAQVYRARTKAGDDVAVKVQRPGIKEVIDTDIRILRRLASLAESHLPEAAMYEPTAMIDEFAATIHQELDFVREGWSADRFRKAFEGDGTVHVPKVYSDLSATRVLTMEYIHGTKISDNARLDALGLDRKAIAFNGANLILNEIFEVHRFHADPHPGNLFVLGQNVIAPVDFGMIGMLDQESVEQLRVVLTAIVNKDVESLTDVVLRLCGAGDPTHAGTIQLELADLLERYYEVPLKQLNMKDITRDVTGILRRHKLHFPYRMAMITRALMTLESVGSGLYPDFNVFEIMEPYARKLLIRKPDFVKALRDMKNTVDATVALANSLPSDISQILAMIKRNDVTIKFEHRGLERMSAVLDKSSNRLSFAVVIAALIIGSSLVFQSGVGPNAYDYSLLGLVSLSIASILGLWLLIGILRAGRL